MALIRTLIRESRVLDLGSLPAPHVPPRTTVYQAVQHLVRGRRGAIVVAEGLKPLGVFTERDVISRLGDGLLGSEEARKRALVEEVMSSPAHTIQRRATLLEAIEVMDSCRHRHLVVVDRNDDMKGLLTTNDIVQFLTDKFPEDAINLPPHLHQRYLTGEGA